MTAPGQDTWLLTSEKSLNVLIHILAYSSAVYFFSFVTADPDLWGHIKFGKDMWEAKAFQWVDIYSYTAFESQWINHEWLSELIMYFAYHAFGSPGLLIGKLLVGFCIVFLLSRISFHRICQPLVYGMVFVLSIFVMCPGFMIRPQLFTFLFTACFLYIFHLYLDRGKNLLWSLPLIMVAWVNSHGGFLIGVGMFPVVVVSEYTAFRVRKRDTAHLRRMLFWLVLTEAAVLINPYGWYLLDFLYKTLSLPRDISEWHPVTVFDFSYIRFKLLALLFISTFFIRNQERRYWEAGIIALAVIYAFMHQRHTPVFAIVAAPYLSENLSLLVQRTGILSRIRTLSSNTLLSMFILLLISFQIFFAGYKYFKAEWNIIVNPSDYPVYAVRFLEQNGIKGKILVPFDWGEYVIWKLYPDSRVSIDGRFRTVYPEEVLRDHFEASKDVSKLKQLLDKYPADILLGKQNPLYRQMISNQDRWVYVYSDPTSILFIKDNKVQKDSLESFYNKQMSYPEPNANSLTYFP
ncbi:MAG: hypothetical protein K9M96_06505 [Deltaproteobacteria bacterium]|nr:hypothetical protein [Deltaproteobacteria bacterium]